MSGPPEQLRTGRTMVVTYPFVDEAGSLLLGRLVTVLEAIGQRLDVVTGKFQYASPTSRITNLPGLGPPGLLRRTGRQVITQLAIAELLVERRRTTTNIVFLIGAGLAFPILVSRLLGQAPIVVLTGLGSRKQLAAVPRQPRIDRLRESSRLLLLEVLERMGYLLASTLVVYGQSMISAAGIGGYREKVRIAHEHFVEDEYFVAGPPVASRKYDVAFIGRLSSEKGVRNFLEALPLVSDEDYDLRALVGGSGPLSNMVEQARVERKGRVRVEFPGWISHADLPEYLRNVKLLVLPSYTEGLPKILLEAMACGVVALATPVGSIPDVIQNGSNGFLLDNNDPRCIADSIRRVLRRPDIGAISEAATETVRSSYTLSTACATWIDALQVA